MGKRIRDDLMHLLASATPKASALPFGGESMATLIANGTITRERCCDGKTVWNKYDRAAQIAREMSVEYGTEQYAYACPFCSRFHIATDELAPLPTGGEE